MTMDLKTHAFVMAGGSGSRLQPLTTGQCKPALSFGGDHRVVDFVLANLRNSGIERIDLLVQYQPDGLVEHVTKRWLPETRSGNGHGAQGPGLDLRIAAPELQHGARVAPCGYRGTADAVYQNLERSGCADADLIAVFGADHVYRMDVRQMIDFHVRHAADVTIAALPVPLEDASSFGIIVTDGQGRAQAFEEKPAHATPMPGRPGHALASMGNYLFSARVLRQALEEACGAGEFDFGHHVLPRLLQSHRVMVYDFHRNVVPGAAACEEQGYWRDVGTIAAFFEAHMDTLGAAPRFALDNPHWPLAPRRAGQAPALVVRGQTSRSRLGHGAVVDRAHLEETVVGRNVKVLAGARLQRCVLFDNVSVGTNARLRNVIVDEDNQVPADTVIGYDRAHDAARFHVTEEGIVVVPRGHFPRTATAQTTQGAQRALALHG